MEGVYVLWDGNGFYIGETGDLDKRMKFHRREGRELVSFIPVEGGAFARHHEESRVIEAFRSMGQPLTNPRPRCYDSIGRRNRLSQQAIEPPDLDGWAYHDAMHEWS